MHHAAYVSNYRLKFTRLYLKKKVISARLFSHYVAEVMIEIFELKMNKQHSIQPDENLHEIPCRTQLI